MPPPTDPPENTVAPALSNTAPRVGQTVTCSTGAWTNHPSSYTYQWLRDGTPIVGQTASSHVVVSDDIGAVLSCEVTAHNAIGDSAPEESNGTNAILSNDTSLSVFTVEGQNAVDGGSLDLDNTYIGAVIGGLTIVATPTNGGATVGTKSITPSPLVEGANVLEFDVTAEDGVASNHYNVTLTVAAALGVPVNTVPPALDDTTIKVGETVTCDTGTWTNTPTGYVYQWLRDGSPIGGATTNSRVATEDDVGAALSCEVTASNAAGDSAPEESNATDPVEALSNDTSLSTFTVEGQAVVDGGALTLDDTHIGDEIGDLTIVATPTDALATVGTKTIDPTPLDTGVSELEFDVTAEDSTVQHYNVSLVIFPNITGLDTGTITDTTIEVIWDDPGVSRDFQVNIQAQLAGGNWSSLVANFDKDPDVANGTIDSLDPETQYDIRARMHHLPTTSFGPFTDLATNPVETLGGGFAFIDGVSADGTANDATTGAIDTTGADLLIALATDFPGGTQSVVTDSKGNSWNSLASTTESPVRTRLWWCVPTSVGSGHTFTTTGAGSSPTICVAAFSGAHASPLDQENGAGAGGVTSLQPGSITPSEDDELIISGLGFLGTITGLSSTGYTSATQLLAPPGGFFGSALYYQIQTSASAENPTWNWTGSTTAVARIASFKVA